MQVLLNTEPHTPNRHSVGDYLQKVVTEALGHYGERVTRVDAHLSDANSPAKADTDEIHCTLEAQLAGLEPVVVKDRAASAHQAIHGALVKLERAIDRVVGRKDPRHAKRLDDDPAFASATDVPG